jgi:hypothetical protein
VGDENNEAECRRICERLSEVDGYQVIIEQQVRGRIAIGGVYRRFQDWAEALEYLQEALAAAEYYRTTHFHPASHPPYGTKPTKKGKSR